MYARLVCMPEANNLIIHKVAVCFLSRREGGGHLICPPPSNKIANYISMTIMTIMNLNSSFSFILKNTSERFNIPGGPDLPAFTTLRNRGFFLLPLPSQTVVKPSQRIRTGISNAIHDCAYLVGGGEGAPS